MAEIGGGKFVMTIYKNNASMFCGLCDGVNVDT